MQQNGGNHMQNKLGYLLMGLGAAFFVQSLFKRASQTPENGQVADGRGANVIDLVAWRRDMPNWR
jgi:hypothetical protein